MEKQEMEWNRNWKWKLEMEIGNWKSKWEQKNAPITGLHSVLSHYFCILLGNGYRTGFMCYVLCLYSCTVFCDYCFWLALMWLQSSLVHMWVGQGTRLVAIWPSELYTYFVLEQGQHSYSCSLVPRPTSSFDCLQCVKQIMASYPGPGYNSPVPRTCTRHIYTESAVWNTKDRILLRT